MANDTAFAGAAATVPPDRPWMALTGHRRRLGFEGTSGALFGIFVTNLLLTLVTLGIYRFWARTRMRRYVWSHVRLDDEPFEYTGTGGELMRGFLKALLFLVPLFVLFAATNYLSATMTWKQQVLVSVPQYVILAFLVYLGRYAARRYQMSRTTWRGIRFHQGGSAWRYAWTAMTSLALCILTLGLYVPFYAVALKRLEMGALQFGNQAFGFEGEGRALLKPFLVAWLLAIPTLGLSMFWYAARAQRYYAAQTRFEGLDFSLPVTGWQMFRLYAGNFLLLVISLGLLYPVTVRRALSFWIDRLAATGAVDPARIAQAPRGAANGEGLAGFLDISTMGV